MRTTRVLFLDDERGIAEGMVAALARDGIEVIGIETDVDGAVATAATQQPDVIVADIDIAGRLALVLPARLDADGPPILWWSGHAGAYRVEAMRAGGVGFVGKRDGLGMLVDAIRRVAAGEIVWSQSDLRADRQAPRPPSAREMDVLRLVAAGRTNREVADELGISNRTVGTHLQRMYDEYGVGTRQELILTAYRRGWISRTV